MLIERTITCYHSHLKSESNIVIKEFYSGNNNWASDTAHAKIFAHIIEANEILYEYLYDNIISKHDKIIKERALDIPFDTILFTYNIL